MKLKRISPWLIATAFMMLGMTSTMLTDMYTNYTVEDNCRDTIIALPSNSRLSGEPCSPDQSMQYMRDLDLGAYIICTCAGHNEPRGLMLPMLPGITVERLDPDIIEEPAPSGDEVKL